MSWMQKLNDTYESCVGNETDKSKLLLPISHTTQQAHIEIVLDGDGRFKRASVLDKNMSITLIPCTEQSVGRSGKSPVHHPLCDKLQYLAGDYQKFGGDVTVGFSKNPQKPFQEFSKSLKAWVQSQNNHPKINAIFNYIQKNCVIADLVESGILFTDSSGKLLKKWNGDASKIPPIFTVIPKSQAPENAFIRWRVENVGDPISSTWEDTALLAAWISYYSNIQNKFGFCMVKGVQTALAVQHPAKLRHAADKAKLISANDSSGYTFKGRFTDKKGEQACSIGFDVTQKAHNALRWLIERQGYRNGDQVIVSWSVSGKRIPDPFQSTLDLFSNNNDPISPADTAQAFALRLNKAISGYRTKLDPTDDVVVMSLDSATPGRMAITFYRELKGSEFLERVVVWHTRYAWAQNFNGRKFIGSSAPRDIAEAAFGHMQKGVSGKKLLKATIERLLPCIIDARPIPRDLVESIIRRAVNRLGFKRDIKKGNEYEWEKCLGIACSLYKGFSYPKEDFQMTLETEKINRDYLFGRLLAVAEHIEEKALYLAGEKRDTNAARLMQRFSDRPSSTWYNLRNLLSPYMTRLRSKRPDFLYKMKGLLDQITNAIQPDDFTSDKRLSGEFLLGYCCQRFELQKPKSKIDRNVDELHLSQES